MSLSFNLSVCVSFSYHYNHCLIWRHLMVLFPIARLGVWPECFGTDIKLIFCCLEFDCRYCKFRDPTSDRPDRPDQCFIFSDGTNSCIKPKTLVRGHIRLCCLNQRCAIPMDEEVPCIFNICGLTFFYKGIGTVQCCANFMKLEEIAYKGLWKGW